LTPSLVKIADLAMPYARCRSQLLFRHDPRENGVVFTRRAISASQLRQVIAADEIASSKTSFDRRSPWPSRIIAGDHTP